jgi:PII-like signaling protein
MSEPAWKLSAYFSERLRTFDDGADRPVFLADQILNLCDIREVATSVMLRGIASFGPLGVLRTDESLSLSEDPPAVIYAVDGESTISGLVDEVAAMTARGLITLERAQFARGEIGPDLVNVDTGSAVKLTVYVGRQVRVGGVAAYRAICDLLHAHEFAFAAALLGVDGTAHGKRYRARFFSRNVNVPVMIISSGTAAQVAAASAQLKALIPDLLLTVERIQLCKREGELLEHPHELPPRDRHGRALWQKLMVHTTEADGHHGVPIHRELVRRLLKSKTVQGATALRGIWGFHGDRNPQGDRLFQLVRQVPVVTIIVDTPESIARTFEVVHELTAEHGVVTCEMVPAALSIHAPGRRGDLQLAEYDYE